MDVTNRLPKRTEMSKLRQTQMQKCFFYECKMESFHQLRLPKEPTLAVGHKRKLKPNAANNFPHKAPKCHRLAGKKRSRKKLQRQETQDALLLGCKPLPLGLKYDNTTVDIVLSSKCHVECLHSA